MSHFVKAWKVESTRAEPGSPHPERTVERYCRYDEPHRDSTFSPSYVNHLVRRLGVADGHRDFLGMTAVPTRTAQTSAP